MTLGIALKVDAQQVREAKRDLEFLNKKLKETENIDVSFGGDQLARDAEQLRRIGLELTRLGNLARTGDNRGGFLNPRQLEVVNKLTKDIGAGLGGWLGQTAKLRNELKQVSSDLRQVQRDMTSPNLSAKARDLMLEDVEVLTGRREDLQKELARRAKYDARAQHMSRRAMEHADVISGFGQAGGDSEGGGAALYGLGKKALGYGMAFLGIGSMMGLIKSSWDKDQAQEMKEAGLLMRGVTYHRRVSPWGYTPQEEAEGIMGLRRTTGAGDMETLSRLERFSRLGNMDIMTSLGIAGGYYSVTGSDPMKQRAALDALLLMGRQAKDGKSETLLQMINTNLMTAQQAQGGRALTDGQISQVAAQTIALYNQPGTMGKSPGLFNAMQNAMMPNGNPVSEVMQWEIAGGFDGPMTPAKYGEIMRRRANGLNDPENLRRASAGAGRFAKDRAGQVLYWQAVRGTLGNPREYEVDYAINELFGPAGKLTGVNDPRQQAAIIHGHLSGKMPSDEIDKLVKSYQATKGYEIGQRDARTEFGKLGVGTGAESVAGGAKGYISRGLEIFGEGVQRARFEKVLTQKARAKGLDVPWILSMMGAESGGNPNAVSRKGAVGLMQVLPSTAADYGYSADSLKDPEANMDVALLHIQRLLKKYDGDYRAMTLAYNEGEGNYDKGIRPAETIKYLAEVQRRSEGWRTGDAPAGIPSEGEIVKLLREIASNTNPTNRTSVVPFSDYAGMMGGAAPPVRPVTK